MCDFNHTSHFTPPQIHVKELHSFSFPGFLMGHPFLPVSPGLLKISNADITGSVLSDFGTLASQIGRQHAGDVGPEWGVVSTGRLNLHLYIYDIIGS
jgi:hypothetical protein